MQLDIEVAGSIAPAANIVVYFGLNQGGGFHDAISAAVSDAAHDPLGSVDSVGAGPESGYSQQDMDAMEQVFQKAATLGITVCAPPPATTAAATGRRTARPMSISPASSPYVLGCGGTHLPKTGHETAWNSGAEGGASGGGYSRCAGR